MCSDSLTSVVNNYHAIDRLLYVQASIFFLVALRPVFGSCLLLPRSFEITLRHSTLGRILRPSNQTLRPLIDNTQQTHINALGGIWTPISASERTQTHALDRPSTGIGFSVIYPLYLALCCTMYLLDQHKKAQENQNKLANFIIKKEYTKTILCSIDYVL